jgi:predicted XRE-type DNA-binding protein
MVDYESLDDGVLKSQNVDRVTSVEKFEQRSWDRDNIEQRVNEIQSNHQTIETILQDINEQLDSIPSEEELEEEWSGYLDRVKTNNQGKATQLPRAFFEAESDRSDLLLRQAIWQARLKELESFARGKLADKFDQLLEEYRTAQSHETLNQMLEEKAEHFATEKVDQKASEIKEWKNQIEKMGQSFREEKRSLWAMMERVAEEDTNSLSESDIESAMVSGLNEFITSNGVFTLDEAELEQDSKESDRKETAENVAKSVVEEDDSEEDDGKTAREQLMDNWEDYYSMMSQQDIADELEVDQSRVSQIINDEGLKE